MTLGALTVDVELGTRRYPIYIGQGILALEQSYRSLGPLGSCVVVSNQKVGPIFAGRVASALANVAGDVHLLSLPDGEAHKNWTTLQSIFDVLLANRCDRATTLFALGGGVVGDLTGFAAACFMRGIRYVQLPTTLLAQVDSSVGGKTAINHPFGKNMIGAFHQPIAVIADADSLDTLPQREFVSGLAEVIKYGLVADQDFLHELEGGLDSLLTRDKQAICRAVVRSCEIKAGIVAEDEFEGGPRAILNFGHTFAHAIEAGTGYGTWLHGEAVGCGMVMAANLSVRAGILELADADRILRIVLRAGLPTKAPSLGVARYLELMRLDKKTIGGEMRFVLLTGLGRAVLRTMPEADVAHVIESSCA